VAHKIAKELASSRREQQQIMEEHEIDITFEEYYEREQKFTQALELMKQEKWSEGELIFRQLTETGSRIPSYWENLGFSLIMQHRYDEAEEAFKQALAIDPDYSFAHDNLRRLPQIRHGKKIPIGVSSDL
jgi:tetratricopeptide (TPR) repeat protein